MSFRRVRTILLSATLALPATGLLAQETPPNAPPQNATPQNAPQNAPPTTAPAEAPMAGAPTTQSVAANPDTPRGALKALVLAMRDGDTSKIKTIISTTNPTEQKMVDAMATMSVSTRKLRTAAEAAYGPGAKELTGETEQQTADGMAKIDSAPEKIDGDTATVDPNNQPGVPPLTLKKINGTWHVPIGELSRGADPTMIQQRLDDLAFLSKMMDESADEVSRGMYKTPKDANDAIKSKMMVAMMKRANAATQQSTTQPSGGSPPMEAPTTAPSNPGM